MGALLLSLAYKKLTLSKLQEALVKTLEITALIMVLVAASNFFGAVFELPFLTPLEAHVCDLWLPLGSDGRPF